MEGKPIYWLLPERFRYLAEAGGVDAFCRPARPEERDRIESAIIRFRNSGWNGMPFISDLLYDGEYIAALYLEKPSLDDICMHYHFSFATRVVSRFECIIVPAQWWLEVELGRRINVR